MYLPIVCICLVSGPCELRLAKETQPQASPRSQRRNCRTFLRGAFNVAYNISAPFQGPSPASVRNSRGHTTTHNDNVRPRANYFTFQFKKRCVIGGSSSTDVKSRCEECPKWNPLTLLISPLIFVFAGNLACSLSGTPGGPCPARVWCGYCITGGILPVAVT